MTGRPPPDRLEEFLQLSEKLSTKELAEYYGKAKRTIRDWKGWARGRGHHVGLGNAQAAGVDGEVTIAGVFPDYSEEMLPIEELWDRAKERQLEEQRLIEVRDSQKINLPSDPVAVMWSSDVHIGSPHTDYITAELDFETVANTPGFYSGFHGDLGDNWVIGSLTAQARNQRLTLQDEIRLGFNLLGKLGPKLLWAVAGNHDNWEYVLTGRDGLAQALSGMKLLYDPHEIVFTMTCGNAEWLVKVRHKWRGYSKFNDTHAIEVGYNLDTPFDIGVGGHTHTGTWCRPFHQHKKRRYAIITGTYKFTDGYARKLGFKSTCGLGSGATVVTPDRDFVFFENIQLAAKFLRFLRLEWGIVDDKIKGKRK